MRKNNFIGIDIGCTNIKLMAKLSSTIIFKSFKTGNNLTKNELINIITNFFTSITENIDGIGIAFSGVTFNGKNVEKTSLPCLKEFSIFDLDHLNIPITLINDSNATTLAGTIEYPNSKVLVGITNGTGIGLGVAINGILFNGASGLLGEIYGNYTMTETGNLNKIGRIISGNKIMNSNNL